MKSRYLLFFLILIYIISPCTATGDYKFRTMSPSGGFYYDGIKAIEQDKEGFIWTMMDYELYRFDGYHYKKYYPYFASMAPTKRWIFNNMASDLLGYLYVNTNNGVYRYDRNSDQFEKIYDPVSHIKVDKANNVWIRIKEKWSILNTQTGELNTPNYDGKAAGGVNTAFCIYSENRRIQRAIRPHLARRCSSPSILTISRVRHNNRNMGRQLHPDVPNTRIVS